MRAIDILSAMPRPVAEPEQPALPDPEDVAMEDWAEYRHQVGLGNASDFQRLEAVDALAVAREKARLLRESRRPSELDEYAAERDQHVKSNVWGEQAPSPRRNSSPYSL